MKREEFIEKAIIAHGNYYDYSLVGDCETRDKVSIICPIHGVFIQKVANHIYGRKTGCPICGKQKAGDSRRKHKIGETYNNEYGEYKIVGIKPHKKVIIRFTDTGTEIETFISNVISGSIKDFNKPKIFGVGYIGIARDKVGGYTKDKVYTVWHNMLKRCYDRTSWIKHPTYKDCLVCDQWLCFRTFQEWYNKNKIEGFYLDKDILFKGNKVYSPDTCCFVPNEINSLFTKRQNCRGELPIGVQYSESKLRYKSFITTGKNTFLGYYDTPQEAFLAYKKAKEDWIKKVANKWKDKIKDNVYQALINYKVEYSD